MPQDYHSLLNSCLQHFDGDSVSENHLYKELASMNESEKLEYLRGLLGTLELFYGSESESKDDSSDEIIDDEEDDVSYESDTEDDGHGLTGCALEAVEAVG